MKAIRLVTTAFSVILFLPSCEISGKPIRYDHVSISEGYTEARFETSGSLSFQKTGKKIIATVHPHGMQSCSVEWPTSATPYHGINPTKRYRFEFLEAIINDGFLTEAQVDTTLLRIKDDRTLLFDRSICQLHSISMDRTIEEIVSLKDYNPFKNYFINHIPQRAPNDGKRYDPCGSGLRHLKWRCPVCYRISEEWREKHIK